MFLSRRDFCCRPCESRDPYSVPYREDTAYGSRLFGRDDSQCVGTNSTSVDQALIPLQNDFDSPIPHGEGAGTARASRAMATRAALRAFIRATRIESNRKESRCP